jgi:NAD(P)H dehydrogenase (quinone)
MMILTGATGTIGSALMRALRHDEVRVRALAHSGAGRTAIESHGLEAVVGDFDQPETLVSAFAGGDRLFLLSRPTRIR